MAKSTGFGFLKFYFTIISIAGIIGMIVAFGIALYQYFNWLLVEDDEYIAGTHMFYEVQNCEHTNNLTPRPLPEDVDNPTTGERTPEQIEKCKQDARTRILNQRDFEKKESIIRGVVWGGLFLVLFATHFPFILKENN